jgi:hypothetical protein
VVVLRSWLTAGRVPLRREFFLFFRS